MALPPASPLSNAARHAPAQVQAGTRDLVEVGVVCALQGGGWFWGDVSRGMVEGSVSVSQIWGWVMSLSKTPQEMSETPYILSVPGGLQISLSFPTPYLAIYHWPLPDQNTEGIFPVSLPES